MATAEVSQQETDSGLSQEEMDQFNERMARDSQKPVSAPAAPLIDPAEFNRMKNRLHDFNVYRRECRELEAEIAEMDVIIGNLQKELKDAKKERETRIGAMRLAIRRQQRQGVLFNRNGDPIEDDEDEDEDEDDTPAAPATEAVPLVDAPIAELGGAKGWTEKLIEKEIDTVSKLEKWMASGKFTPGQIKGIGQTAIDKITDLLVKFRAEHPVPTADEPTPETANDAAAPAVESVEPPAEDNKPEWQRIIDECDRLLPRAHLLIGTIGQEANGWRQTLMAIREQMDAERYEPVAQEIVASMKQIAESIATMESPG